MRRIAVLPFVDISPEKDQEYFCDGLAEELINTLRTIRTVNVVPRTSSFRFRESTIGIREIGKQLDVDCVLEGSVRKAGGMLRIVVNLIGVEDEAPIWSERYDRDVAEVFAVQDEISQGVAQRLQGDAAGDPTPAVQAPKSVDTYETYLRARHEWNKRTPESLRASIRLFGGAIADDPDYALAHAGLADSYVTLAVYGAAPPMEVLPLARRSAERAIELKHDLAEAQASLACIEAVYDWNWAGAIRRFRQAIELDPQYPPARQSFAMHCLTPLGRFSEAREQIEAARKMDPDSLVIQMTDGVQYYFERNFEKAADAHRKILDTNPDFAMAHYFLGQACLELNRNVEAIAELEKAVALTERSAETVAALGYAQSIAGSRIDAVQLAMELTRRAIQDYVSPVLQAQVRIGLGDLDTVFGYFENAYQTKSSDLIWIGIRPTMDPLRSDPRFQDLCRRVGVVA